MNSKAKALAFSCAALIFSACAHSQKATISVSKGAPDWVNKGSGAMKDAGQSVFYGVGIAQGIRNRALQVSASDDRARAEIAKILNSYIVVLSKDYMASTTGGDMTQSSEEQHVQQTLKNFAKFTLTGAIIVDHWRDPADGTMFALCRFDMDAMKKTLDSSKELDAKTRDFVRTNAEKAFDELQAEEAKH